MLTSRVVKRQLSQSVKNNFQLHKLDVTVTLVQNPESSYGSKRIPRSDPVDVGMSVAVTGSRGLR
jgi:hypothetical protein